MQDSSSRSLVFTGSGAGYFRIWIVNLLLSIVTIGLYTPWAKVRRIRYFYGNTQLDGSPFEFHGRPLALLWGRLIGLVLLAAYSQTAKFSVTLWLVVVAGLIALFPWLLWKSLRFRLLNSSYRGVHFGFDGTVGQAYLTYLPMIVGFLAPTLILVTVQHSMTTRNLSPAAIRPYFAALALLLLLAPWFYFRIRAYQHRHARLGTTPFAFDGTLGRFYVLAIKVVLFGLLMMLIGAIGGGVVGGLVWVSAVRSTTVFDPSGPSVGWIASFAVGIAVFYLLVFSTASFVKAMIQNFVWNHSSLGGERFTSDVGRFRLWRIELVNLALTLVTLGFFWPFAVVRSMRYRIEAIGWSGDSDALIAHADEGRVGATGEETADLFGLDLAL